MAATSRGYPYPLGTDRVMDGDDAIHALAQAVEDKLGGPQITGPAAVPALAAGASSSTAVTFPAGRFTVAPNVFCTALSSRVIATPGSITTTGFVMGILNPTSGGATAHTGAYFALAPIA